MRKLFLICTLFLSIGASAQVTPTTDSIRRFVDANIRNSSIQAFTNLRLNTSLKWITSRLDTLNAKVDTTSLSNRINAKQNADADLTTYASITPTTVAQSLLAFVNPSAIRFFRINVDNTVSGRTPSEMLSDIGAAASSHTHAVSTDITGMGLGVSNFLVTPSSENLAAALTNETGSGSVVYSTSPTLVTPNIGTPSAATLTNATGLPISTGVSGLGIGVASFLGSPSSANLASAVTGETGTGALVFGTSPDFTTGITIGAVEVPTISSLHTFTGKSISGADNTLSNIPQSAVTNLTTALDLKVDKNASITGATKTKITYDSKGLVTAGADATTTDIGEGTNQYFTNARARSAISVTTTGPATTYSSSTGIINIPDDPSLQVAALLGSTIKGATLNGHTFINSASSLSIADGTIYWCAAWLPKGATLTGFKFWQQTSGVYTADNNNKIGLYTYDGAGTLTLVGATLNDANLWAGAGASTITAPLSATYAANAGLYFIAVLYNSSAVTTAPTIGTTTAAGLSGAAGFDFTNSAKTFGTTTAQLDLPATQLMSGITGITARPYVALY